MNKSAVILCPLMLAVIGNTYAAQYSVKQLSDPTVYNYSYSKINEEGSVVWGVWDAADNLNHIDVYDAEKASRIRLGSAVSAAPDAFDINRRGDVIWYEFTDRTGSGAKDLFVYQARSGSVTKLTSGDYDDRSYAVLGDNGDVAWLATSGEIMRFDASAGSISALVFPGATRQGSPRIDRRGDVVWQAMVGDYNQILLYRVGDGSITNLSRPGFDDWGNHQINARGDVLWNGSDGNDTELYLYVAKTKTIVQLTDNDVDDEQFKLGANDDIAWLSGYWGNFTVMLRTAEGQTKVLETTTRYEFPQVNARGDVVWTSLSDTGNVTTNLYDGARGTTIQLTSGWWQWPYDLRIADNGDVAYSLWDGSDYEMYTYQPNTKKTTQLTDNGDDDGIAAIDAEGDVSFAHFGANSTDIMLARKKDRREVRDLVK